MEDSRRFEVMVVDDTAGNLILITKILSDAGYKVRPASSGHQALRAIKERKPDLILLDVRMPGMGGFEVCRQMKANSATSSIPVLFISASDELLNKVEGFECGGVDYVTKPFQAEELLARVGTQLRLYELTERMEMKIGERTRELTEANDKVRRELGRRVSAERDLRESEEKFRTIFERSPIGKVLSDPDGRILMSNQSFADMIGYAQDEICETDFSRIASPGSASPSEENLRDEGRFERSFKRRDGRLVVANVTSTLIRDDKDSPRFLMHSIEDITERKDAEERLKSLNADLIQGIKEKDALLRELFHRTRNNMQVIISLLCAEADRINDPLVSEVIRKSNQRIMTMSLVHKKLYERNDLSTVDLKDYCQDLIQFLLEDDPERSDSVRIDLAADNVPVLIDTAIPFGLVAYELLSNALRHAYPQGQGGRIRVSLHKSGDGEIGLEVSDDGAGLPLGLDAGKGETLGFWLVNNLVKSQLNGRVWFVNEHGLSCHLAFFGTHALKRV
jgi:PAS domain S-box-containing protein